MPTTSPQHRLVIQLGQGWQCLRPRFPQEKLQISVCRNFSHYIVLFRPISILLRATKVRQDVIEYTINLLSHLTNLFLSVNTASEMWIGMLNQDFSLCIDLATCQPLFTWIDGERTTAANSNHLGVRMLAVEAESLKSWNIYQCLHVWEPNKGLQRIVFRGGLMGSN